MIPKIKILVCSNFPGTVDEGSWSQQKYIELMSLFTTTTLVTSNIRVWLILKVSYQSDSLTGI